MEDSLDSMEPIDYSLCMLVSVQFDSVYYVWKNAFVHRFHTSKTHIDIVDAVLLLSRLGDVFSINVDEVEIIEKFEMNNMYNDIDHDDRRAVFDNDNPSHDWYQFEKNNIYMNILKIDERLHCI